MRTELIQKFERNLNFITEFKTLYENYLNKSDTWGKRAFVNSSITNNTLKH